MINKKKKSAKKIKKNKKYVINNHKTLLNVNNINKKYSREK